MDPAARGERLGIIVDRVLHDFDAVPELELLGADREFSDLIARHLHALGGGLRSSLGKAAGPADSS